MNQSSPTDIESTPLVIASKEDMEVIEVPAAASSLSKTARVSIALVSLMALCAVAQLSYESSRGMSLFTSLKRNSIYASDVSICENTYVEGVTPRTAAPGCVLLSVDDLYGKNYMTKAMRTQVVCIASSGPSNGRVDLTRNNLQQLGFIDLDGKSILSGINPGANVNVVLYSGENFDGESVIVDTGVVDGALPVKEYPSKITTNDNVYSLSVVSQSEYFFAGPQCGQDTQICYGLMKNADVVKPQPNGCILFSNQDPLAPGKERSRSAVSRVCTTRKAAPFNSNVVVLARTALSALSLFKRNSKGISFINRQGETTTLGYYTNGDSTGTHHSHTGRLGIWNDDIQSLTISAKTNQLPDNCGTITRK